MAGRHDSATGRHDSAAGRHDSAAGRHDSAAERHDSAAGRQTIRRLRGGSAAVSQKFNFDEFFMAFSILFHYNENDG